MLKNENSDNPASLLFYLALLTSVFLLLEISYFIQCNSAYVEDYKLITTQIAIPSSIIPSIIFFIGVQLAIHIIYCLLVWFSVIFCSYLLRLSKDTPFWLALFTWFLGLTAALNANQYLFPNSKYAQLLEFLLPSGAAAIWLALIVASVFCVILVTGMIGFIVWFTEKSFNYALLLMLFISACCWTVLNHTSSPLVLPVKHSQPNVIIIGVDSLRPDYTGYFGADHETPFFDYFLNQATVFSEAVTPIARTFPSWAAILTGNHPRETGIRSNLVSVDKLDLSHSLPSLFKQHGYRTIYATDETRFSNIDRSFGFNEILTAPAGLSDFILGTLNDFPFSNLLVNTALGHWLFPHSYANRPAFVTYNPDSFINLLAPALMQTAKEPLFMAVHFCLPHFPYLYDARDSRDISPEALYENSIQRVDQQVNDFFQLLTRAHLLDHAVVVLLSDHGEALELSGDRITERDYFVSGTKKNVTPPQFYPPNLDHEKFNQSAGHGTDVLGLPQYHALLAVKLFGMGEQHTGVVPGVLPLTDLKPALLALAGIKEQGAGQSGLAAVVRGTAAALPLQHVFLESDYSPAAIRSLYPEVREAMLDGLRIYEVNPKTARLNVKENMMQMIIRSKQYADIYGDWMLALYPQHAATYTPILINLQTGKWTNNLQSSFAKHSPSAQMLSRLKKFYGQDIASD